MKLGAPGSFGAHLRALRENAGFTQEELATIAGISVHAVSALERGERRRPHVETVRALSAALDLTNASRDAFLESARAPARTTAVDELIGASLPLPLTRLVGRDTEMQTVRQWLADPASRLITLVGPGGVGKTRLGLELTRAIAAESTARVAFVSLASIRDAQFVAPAIAEVLGLSNVTPLNLPARARLACSDQPTLLMLDNFEQVLEAAQLVVDLLTSVGSLRFLVTSRAPLRVRGEREFVVGPLALELPRDAVSPADVVRAPGVRLFVDRVRDVQPDFRLTAANASAVTAICRRLDALPLALELAAPWMKVLPVEDLLRRLTQDALLPAVGRRDLPERQQTINATVAWSYQLLAPVDQRVFRRLGALPGRFPIDAAAAVIAGRDGPSAGSDQPLGALAALIDKSLLLRAESAVPGRPLYQMLETVRAYAALELSACGERDDAVEGLALYCIREAALTDQGLVGPAQVEWLDRVRNDLDSYRSAMAWLIAAGRPAGASEIAFALRYFWLIRGHVVEGMRWYQQILSMPSVTPAAESKALVGASVMCFALGELAQARMALARALALTGPGGDADVLAHCEYMLAHVERAAGNPDLARTLFISSLERFRALNVPSGAAKALTGLAAIALAAGDTAEAERRLDESASLLQDDAPWFLSFALWIRALLALKRGHADRTMGWVRESLVRIRDLNDRFAFVYAVVPLAAAAALKGNDAWAARILGMRDGVAERTGAALVDRLVHDVRTQAEADVRARLGPVRWAQAYAAGRGASIESLLKDIDRALA